MALWFVIQIKFKSQTISNLSVVNIVSVENLAGRLSSNCVTPQTYRERKREREGEGGMDERTQN